MMKERSEKKFPHKRRPMPVPKLPRPLRDANGPIRPKPAADPEATATPATHWGEVAQWYDQLVGEEGSEYHREVVLPGALRLLGVKAGDHVVDIACGQGVLCRTLARQGVLTTGIDAAADLIRHAKDRNRQLAPAPGGELPLPTYYTADVRDLPFVRDDEFEAGACLLAIQNLNPIGPVFSTVARTLKPMGRFVIVMMHPCFRGAKESSWGWDDKAKVQYRRVDRYLLPRKTPIITHPGINKDYTWTFHKPIESYVKGLRSAGLLVDALEEWPSHKTSTSGPRAGAENVARKEIPMFLALRAVKIPGVASLGEGCSSEANVDGPETA
jgi:ubiquinone/menaquinone biosynthesis C-methylase UbiE